MTDPPRKAVWGFADGKKTDRDKLYRRGREDRGVAAAAEACGLYRAAEDQGRGEYRD